MRKERSCSGGMFEFPPSSPNLPRRNKDAKSSGGMGSSTRGRYLHGNLAQLIDLTIFHIPGLDVKVSTINIIIRSFSQHVSYQYLYVDPPHQCIFSNFGGFLWLCTKERDESFAFR